MEIFHSIGVDIFVITQRYAHQIVLYSDVVVLLDDLRWVTLPLWLSRFAQFRSLYFLSGLEVGLGLTTVALCPA